MTRDEFTTFILAHRAELVRLAYRHLHLLEDSEDCVQTVLASASNPTTYSRIPATKALHYFRRAVKHEVVRWVNRHRKEEGPLARMPALSLRDHHTDLTLTDALAKMPPHIRSLVTLIYLEGVDLDDGVRRVNRQYHKRIPVKRAKRLMWEYLWRIRRGEV